MIMKNNRASICEASVTHKTARRIDYERLRALAYDAGASATTVDRVVSYLIPCNADDENDISNTLECLARNTDLLRIKALR